MSLTPSSDFDHNVSALTDAVGFSIRRVWRCVARVPTRGTGGSPIRRKKFRRERIAISSHAA